MTDEAFAIPGNRITLAAGPSVSPPPPELEVAFVGCCPGFGPVDQLPPATLVLAAAADQAVAALGLTPAPGWFDQPVPVDGADAFRALFAPNGSVLPSGDALAGAAMWLPAAVLDFFGAGGRRAWIVRVQPGGVAPEAAHVPPIPDGRGLGDPPIGLLAACAVPSVGLVVLPDLERLYAVPEVQMPVPPPIPVPVPVFHPAGASVARMRPAVVSPAAGVLPAAALPAILARLNATLARKRPDMTAIFTLPLGPQVLEPLPALERRVLTLLYGQSTTDLAQLQPLAPLVADPAGGVATPSGLVAGALAAEAELAGPWRSIAGRLLPSAYTPMRRIGEESIPALSIGGIGALQQRPGGLALQQELLAVRSGGAGAAAPTRRFIGSLRRQLEAFGRDLVFENNYGDGRVERALAGFFAALFQRGALAGRRLSSAFAVSRLPSPENQAVFQIGFAPAYSLDRILLSFVQTKDGAVQVTA